MRLPAYGKRLLDLRNQGATPWLVVMALGRLIDADVLKGQPGVCRIGVPDDAIALDQYDFGCLFGLSVLVSCFVPENSQPPAARRWHAAAVRALRARGTPGLLMAVGPGGAHRVDVLGGELCLLGKPVALDAGFRESVEIARGTNLLTAEGVFAAPEFNPARHALLQELCGVPAA